MRGRKPTPTHLKILRGNPGGRPLNKNEPQPKKAKRPTCPAWLNKEAKAAWRRTCAELDAMGILSSADRDVIVAFCTAVSRLREAHELVNTVGSLVVGRAGGLVRNPACQLERDARGDVGRLGAELGLSPSARTRLAVPSEQENDLAAKYLS